MANSNVTLSQLASGMVPSTAFQSNNSCPVVCDTPTLVQVATPSTSNRIAFGNIIPSETCYFQDSFHNASEAARNLIVSGLVAGEGDYLSMPAGVFSVPSAVDFATFTDTLAANTANTGALRFFNRYVDQIPLILGGINGGLVIQASSRAIAQARVSTFTNDASGNTCAKALEAPLCDFCGQSNTSAGVFTSSYNGPLAVGQNVGLMINVPNMTATPDAYINTQFNILGGRYTNDISSCGA